MTASVTEVKFGRQPPEGLAADLRRMADAVDRGEIVDLIACFIQDDSYCYLIATSAFDSIGMASMLHQQALDNMRR